MAVNKSELRQLVCDKLISIGCYIDDELPDYVVAMVVNGKTRQHMNKDLSVFTGAQSDAFLDWLMETVKDQKPERAESAPLRSTARLITREEQASSTKRTSSQTRASSQTDTGNSTASRLLSLAMAGATAGAAKSPPANEDDTSSKRHPQPVAEGTSSSSSSSHSSSRRRSRRGSSQEPQRRESSRSSKSRTATEGSSNGDKSSTSVKTKFIVTLDGAEKMKTSLMKRETAEPVELAPTTESVQFIVNNDLKRKHTEVEEGEGPGAVEQVVSFVDGFEDDFNPVADETTEPLAKRALDRCRFWPNCSSGDSCHFHHPSVPCRKMPACKFGSQCLYLHADCKFDGRCTKVDCPYVHRQGKPGQFNPAGAAVAGAATAAGNPAGAVAAAAVAGKPLPGATICKFHPGCMRDFCPFLHPTPCRYMAKCTRAGCSFYHAPTAGPVQLPMRSALRWSAKKEHVSERKFAVDATAESVIPASADYADAASADV